MILIQEKSKQEVLLDNNVVITIDSFREVIGGVRDELDEHRGAINDNTDEIQANFAYLCELDKKIEKLAARLDELYLAVSGSKVQKEFKIAPLTNREKEVFMALYALGEVQPFVSYKQLARRLSSTESLVAAYLTNLIEKGIPIIKKYDDGLAYVKLDDLFRQLQAKQNLVGVNTVLSYWL